MTTETAEVRTVAPKMLGPTLAEREFGEMICLGFGDHSEPDHWFGDFGRISFCPERKVLSLHSSGERVQPLGTLVSDGKKEGSTTWHYSYREGEFFFGDPSHERKAIAKFSTPPQGWWAGPCGLFVYNLGELLYFGDEVSFGCLGRVDLPSRIWAGHHLVLEVGGELYLLKIGT